MYFTPEKLEKARREREKLFRSNLKKRLFQIIKKNDCTLAQFKSLLDQGADPEWSKNGETALFAAIAARRAEFVTELLSRNVKLTSKGGANGDSPLTAAVRVNCPEIVQKFIDYRMDSRFWVNENNQTPLLVAARYGRLECLKLLVDAGFDLDESDDDGETALHGAAMSDRVACIECLAEAGACLESRDWRSRTPLFLAVERGAAGASETLLRYGADPLVKDRGGNDLLSKARSPKIRALVERAILHARALSTREEDALSVAGMGL